VDRLGLDRAMELMEYWRREAVARNSSSTNVSSERQVQERSSWVPLTEAEAEAQMMMTPRSGENMAGMDPSVTRMPESLREMVRWAEDKKTKHRLN
jgi:hypothetical protein